MKQDTKYILLIMLMMGLFTFIINPFGEFFLYDDWSFIRSLENLFYHNEINFWGWTSMPLITHLLWGYLFVFIFGFSVTVLKFSTLVAGIIGLISCYQIFKSFKITPKVSFFYTIIISSQAIFLNQIYTFNTDITFFCFSMLTTFFFFRFIETEKMYYYILAFFNLIIASLNRDLGIALALSFGISFSIYSYILHKKLNLKIIILSILPILIISLSIIFWRKYLISIDNLPILYDDGRERLLKTLSKNPILTLISFGKSIFLFFEFFGLFLSPILILKSKIFINYYKERQKLLGFLILICVGIFSISAIKPNLNYKFVDILIAQVYGNTVFENIYSNSQSTLFYNNHLFNLITLILGLFGFLLFISFILIFSQNILKSILQNIKSKLDMNGNIFQYLFNFRTNDNVLVLEILEMNKIEVKLLFSLLSIIIYSFPILIAGIYQEYLIFNFVFILIIINYTFDFKQIENYQLSQNQSNQISPANNNYIISASLLYLMLIYFSIATTKDYINDAKAHWELAEELNKKYSYKNSEIDGGIFYNGWFLYDPKYKIQKDKNSWWVIEPKAVVTDNKIQTFSLINQKSYYRYLPPFKKVTIYSQSNPKYIHNNKLKKN